MTMNEDGRRICMMEPVTDMWMMCSVCCAFVNKRCLTDTTKYLPVKYCPNCGCAIFNSMELKSKHQRGVSMEDDQRYKLPGIYAQGKPYTVHGGYKMPMLKSIADIWDIERAWADRDKGLIDLYVFAACTDAIEYIIRHARKGGIEDLKKADACIKAAIDRMEEMDARGRDS